MSWRNVDTGATAATFSATLKTEGYYVDISKETGSTIVFHNGATPLKQLQTVSVGEYRGLTKAAADLLVGLANDATTTVIYYSRKETSVGGTAQYVAAATRSGDLTEVSIVRHNESEEWVARVTKTNYSADGGGVWSTTRPSAATTGVVTSVQDSTSKLQYGNGAGYISLRTTTTVKEFQFLTQAEATALCVSSDLTGVMTASWTDSSGAHFFYYTVGTITSSSMRYIDEANGWTVTQTEQYTR